MTNSDNAHVPDSVVSKVLNVTTGVRFTSAYPAYLCGIKEGDRRGSNPRPSLEPQSE